MRFFATLVLVLIISVALMSVIQAVGDSQGWTITDEELFAKQAAARISASTPSPVVVQYQPTAVAVEVPHFTFTPTAPPS